ncbi:MAG TPA: hypothetical protein VJ180_14885 [Pyrinomonadaceae bacterium]|nr:hypothetical protein [Pyrinomonadaceae bacterium]
MAEPLPWSALFHPAFNYIRHIDVWMPAALNPQGNRLRLFLYVAAEAKRFCRASQR